MKTVLNMPILIGVLLMMSSGVFADQNAVGTLKARHHIVEVYSSEDGPLYTVKNLEGKALASLVSDTEVISQFPNLESIIRGYADDASLGPKPREGINVLKE